MSDSIHRSFSQIRLRPIVAVNAKNARATASKNEFSIYKHDSIRQSRRRRKRQKDARSPAILETDSSHRLSGESEESKVHRSTSYRPRIANPDAVLHPLNLGSAADSTNGNQSLRNFYLTSVEYSRIQQTIRILANLPPLDFVHEPECGLVVQPECRLRFEEFLDSLHELSKEL